MKIAEVSERYGLSQDTLRYYEKVGVIPKVSRSSGGSRDYSDDDCAWVELAQCLRSAGLPVEAIIEYGRLFSLGDSTIEVRRDLLTEQRDNLLKQRESLDAALNRLNYKISVYDEAIKTGKLVWDKSKCETDGNRP